MPDINLDELWDSSPSPSVDDLWGASPDPTVDHLWDAAPDVSLSGKVEDGELKYPDILPSAPQTIEPPKPTEISATPTVTGEIGEGNIRNALGLAYENTRRVFSGLMGPTEQERSEQSIPWGVNEDGSQRYEYKPLGSRLDREQGIFTPYLKVEPMRASPDDSTLAATGKAVFNTAAGIEGSLLSPGGIAMPAAASAEGTTIPMRIASGAFATDMLSHVNEQVKQAATSDTTQGKIEGWLGALTSLAMGYGAAKHSLAGESPKVANQTIQSAPTEALKALHDDSGFQASGHPDIKQGIEVEIASRAAADEAKSKAAELQSVGAPKTADAVIESQPPKIDPVPLEETSTVPPNSGLPEGFVSVGASTGADIEGAKRVYFHNEGVSERRMAEGNLPLDLLNEEPQRNEATWEAGEKLNAKPEYTKTLVGKIRTGEDTAVTPEQEAALMHRSVELQNARNDEAARAGDVNASPEERAAASQEWQRYENELNELDQSLKIAGRTAARALQLRQRQALEDFTLAGMERRQRAAKGDALTPDESSKTKDTQAKIEGAEKDVESTRKKVEQTQRESDDKDSHEQTKKRVTKAAKKGEPIDTTKQRAQIIDRMKARIAEGDSPADLYEFVQLLHENLQRDSIQSGRPPLDRSDVVDRIHHILTNELGLKLPREFTGTEGEANTSDLISGIGRATQLTKDPAKLAKMDVRSQEQKVGKINRYLKKIAAPKTGPERPKPSAEARRLEKEAREIARQNGVQVTDPAKQLATSLEAKKTRMRNEIADIDLALASKTPLVAKKGVIATDAESDALLALRDAKKAEYVRVFGDPSMSPEARLKIALDSATRTALEWQRRLDEAKAGRFGKKPGAPKVTSDQLEAIRAHTEAVKSEVEELASLSDALAETAKEQALERSIASLEEQIKKASSPVPATEKPAEQVTVDSQRVAELKGQQEALQKQLSDIREAAKPTHAEVAMRSAKTRADTRIAQLLDKLHRGDFERVPRTKRVPDDELLHKQAVAESLKHDWLRGLRDYELSKRTKFKKVLDGIAQGVIASKNIVSAFDFSAPRQAAIAVLGHPVTAAKNIVTMMKGWATESGARIEEQRIAKRDNAKNGLDQQAKIEFTPLDESSFTKGEENARSVLDDWAELPLRTGSTAKTLATAPAKIVSRGVRMSNRAFITFLNKTRADLFDSILSANFADRPPTLGELEAVGNLVNVATGRGKLNPMTAKVAAGALWAPKLLASRFQFLAGQPFYRGSARTRAIVAKEYAKVLLGGYALWNVVQLFSDKKEHDPRSSDFGKVVLDNTRIDPWGGLQQVTVLELRLASRATKTLAGDVKSTGPDRRYGGAGAFEIAAQFLRSKLSPIVGSAVDTVAGENLVGEKVTPGSVAVNLSVPLTFRDIYSVMTEQGVPKGTAITILGAFGAGVSNYADKKEESQQALRR